MGYGWMDCSDRWVDGIDGWMMTMEHCEMKDTYCTSIYNFQAQNTRDNVA
jgi:hypothetical protein